VGNGTLVLEAFDIDTGERLPPLEGHTGHGQTLALWPNGDRFASVAEDGFVRVWDSSSLECVWTVKAHDGKAVDVTFYGDNAVITVGADSVGRRWDIV
jgi:WD40 repeat protein